MHDTTHSATDALNVLGQPLMPCGQDPVTGFYRDGCCRVGPDDLGVHAVCAEVTAEFLTFTQQQGNDLATPRPEFGFPGLRPGDRWCLCASRWQEACDAGKAPRVVLQATHQAALTHCRLADLKRHAIDVN